jgi:hypothetical protein
VATVIETAEPITIPSSMASGCICLRAPVRSHEMGAALEGAPSSH